MILHYFLSLISVLIIHNSVVATGSSETIGRRNLAINVIQMINKVYVLISSRKFILSSIHGFWFLECCVEIYIKFHEDEFEKHHESPLVGIYRMTGLDEKNNYMYKHQPRLYRLSRQTDWNWKVDTKTDFSKISMNLFEYCYFQEIINQFFPFNYSSIYR